MSNRESNRGFKSLSTLESEAPFSLYWLQRNKQNDVAEVESVGGTGIISDVFWDEFVIAAKAVKLLNREATLYDVFNFIREHFLGGWTLIENSAFIEDIDSQIEREYQKELRAAG